MLNIALLLTLSAGLMIFLKWFVSKELLDPVFFTAAYWIIFILFSVFISMEMGLLFYWEGIIPIVLLVLAFISGGFVMKQLMMHISFDNEEKKHGSKRRKTLSSVRIKWLVMIFSAMGLLAIYMQLNFLKIQINSLSDLLHAANKISIIRYTGGQDISKFGLVLMAFLYSGGFLAGIYNVVSKGLLNKFISLIPFIVMLIFTMINGVKTGFLFLLVIWISGFAAAHVYDKKGEVRKPGLLILRACIIIALVLLLIPITQILRGGKTDTKIKLVNASALSYFCSFNAFSVWYHSYKNDELTGVKYSLSGVHNFFYGEREIGLYGEQNIEVGKYDNIPIRTNVYTMTRGLIQDFTLYGAMAILFIAGILMQMVYYLTKRKNAFAMGMLALFYSIVLWSFTVNIINYNTLIFSWIISLILIFFINKQKNTAHQTTED
jgi:oligosaccharide repeat unit polymerase